jgi:predicted ribosome quality control (RQC) complex YloA/Tae2 family protein
MSLRGRELAQVVEELSGSLLGALVQRAFMPEPDLGYLELRHLGRTVLLSICVGRDRARLSVAESRRRSAGSALPFQQHLRRELVGSSLSRIARDGERVVALDFRRSTQSRRLMIDFSARDGKLLLLGEEGRILALSSATDLAKSGLRQGGTYQPRVWTGDESAPPSSRLVPIRDAPFPFAQAAEALYQGKDEQQRADEIRRRLIRSLKKKLERISRTREKVLAEASRGPEAEHHRRMGELISQNLHRIKRGEKIARLIEYTERGPVEVEVALHSERSSKQQADWHFHQYRRLLRGSERASARLDELNEEMSEAQQRIEELQRAGDEELLQHQELLLRPRRKSLSRSRPYKEYFSSTGQRIWVGRDSTSNEELTFRIARPDDLWLHARGASGSHVVVPLEKNVELTSELLVDAAHLALHHSSLKGEPRGEIIYARAKHVRRLKGDSAGAVSVVRDKTLAVRLEPNRLAQLLSSRTRAGAD